jgi:hypothetical protein
MARLAASGEEGVSLFPMFNILACTLGVMVFVLATVASVSLGADKSVEYTAPELEGEDTPQYATWMEWDGLDLVLYPSGEYVRFERDLGNIVTFQATYAYMFERVAGTPLGATLADVSGDPDQFLMLLVRPSGFRSLAEIEGYMGLLGIRVVPEPIDQDIRRIQVR